MLQKQLRGVSPNFSLSAPCLSASAQPLLFRPSRMELKAQRGLITTSPVLVALVVSGPLLARPVNEQPHRDLFRVSNGVCLIFSSYCCTRTFCHFFLGGEGGREVGARERADETFEGACKTLCFSRKPFKTCQMWQLCHILFGCLTRGSVRRPLLSSGLRCLPPPSPLRREQRHTRACTTQTHFCLAQGPSS